MLQQICQESGAVHPPAQTFYCIGLTLGQDFMAIYYNGIFILLHLLLYRDALHVIQFHQGA